MFVEVASGAGCKQNAIQHCFGIHRAFVPTNHFGWTVTAIFTLFVCPMSLVIVVEHPLAVDFQRLLPTSSDGEFGIGHSPKDIEMRLDIVLPSLSLLNPLFCDAKRFIDC